MSSDRSELVSCAQVTVTLQVEQSRRACDAVAHGEADCAIIGGDVPEDLASVLQVRHKSPSCVLCTPQGFCHQTRREYRRGGDASLACALKSSRAYMCMRE